MALASSSKVRVSMWWRFVLIGCLTSAVFLPSVSAQDLSADTPEVLETPLQEVLPGDAPYTQAPDTLRIPSQEYQQHRQDALTTPPADAETGATAEETPVPNVPDDARPPVEVPPQPVEPEPARTLTPTTGPAVLQALDKVSAQIEKIEAPLDQIVRFGTLEILVRGCQKAPPEEPAENAAFLEVFDTREGRQRVFSGWMFASSPALSALEHPVYDVWVLDCINASSSPDDSSPVKN